MPMGRVVNQKRGLLLLVLSLALVFSTLAMLSASSLAPVFLNTHPNNSGAAAKSYNGTGDQLNALLYITNNYDNTPNATNTTADIYIPCPNGWKIVWANLSFSNILASNRTIESNYSPTNASMSLSNMYAMSFRLELNVSKPPPPTVGFYLYNAVNNGGNPKPSNQIASITNIEVPNGTNWVSADFGHLFLNVSQTYDNTFFIAINHTGKS
ncbi:MAG: hypothetical protein ACTSP1_18485 [Candidatus Freyarchaeota archaeon]